MYIKYAHSLVILLVGIFISMKIVLLLYDLPSCYRCLLYPSLLTHALPSFIRLSTWRVNCMLDLHVPGVFCLIHHVHAAGRPGGIVAVRLCPHAKSDQPSTAARYLRQDTQQSFRSGPAVILPHTARAVSDHDAMVDVAGNAN